MKNLRTVSQVPGGEAAGTRNNLDAGALLEQIVRQCVEVGLVQGKHLSVDGSFPPPSFTRSLIFRL